MRRGEEGRGQHRGSPNEGDGTAAPPLDAGNARWTTTIQYPRLNWGKLYSHLTSITRKWCQCQYLYLLRSSVLPENLLPVDIGTPPIIILEMLVISIILRLASMRKPISKRNAKGLLGRQDTYAEVLTVCSDLERHNFIALLIYAFWNYVKPWRFSLALWNGVALPGVADSSATWRSEGVSAWEPCPLGRTGSSACRALRASIPWATGIPRKSRTSVEEATPYDQGDLEVPKNKNVPWSLRCLRGKIYSDNLGW